MVRDRVFDFVLLGRDVNETRTSAGHSLRAVARLTGVHCATISRIEGGLILTNISVETAVRLMLYCGRGDVTRYLCGQS